MSVVITLIFTSEDTHVVYKKNAISGFLQSESSIYYNRTGQKSLGNGEKSFILEKSNIQPLFVAIFFTFTVKR
jgi:hypothetical protein